MYSIIRLSPLDTARVERQGPISIFGAFTIYAKAISLDEISGAIAVLTGFIGFSVAMAHYGAVLARRPEREIARATGYGFFFGLASGLATLALVTLL